MLTIVAQKGVLIHAAHSVIIQYGRDTGAINHQIIRTKPKGSDAVTIFNGTKSTICIITKVLLRMT